MPEPNNPLISDQLDPVIHAPIRLRICGFLSALDDAEFMTLRDALGVSDSVLSKHVKQLVTAGYVVLQKGALDGRKRAWVRLTPKGRAALLAHVEALIQLAGQANEGEEESRRREKRPRPEALRPKLA